VIRGKYFVFQASWAALTFIRAVSSVKGGRGGFGLVLVAILRLLLRVELDYYLMEYFTVSKAVVVFIWTHRSTSEYMYVDSIMTEEGGRVVEGLEVRADNAMTKFLLLVSQVSAGMRCLTAKNARNCRIKTLISRTIEDKM
jgi:hypothetical protein